MSHLPLETWEVQVIHRLALEAYEATSVETAIVNRERWLEKAEATRQERAMDDDVFRRSLVANGQRLDVYVPSPPPKRRYTPDRIPVASTEYAARWQNVMRLVKSLPDRNHGYRKAHALLVTTPTIEARDSGVPWAPTGEECYEILHLLDLAEVEFCRAPTEAPSEAPEPEPSLADLLARTKERTP